MNKRIIYTLSIIATAFSTGYFVSYQVHGKYTEAYLDKLIEDFYTDHYAPTVIHDTYKLTNLLTNIQNDNVSSADINNLKNIIEFNIDMVDFSIKGGAKWDKPTHDIHLKVKGILNSQQSKP